jgi:uncharacterized protein YukE
VTGIKVRSESLRHAADRLDDAIDRFVDALEQHEARIHGLGDAFGGDAVGSLSAALYAGIHDMAMECFESNAEVVGQFADRLHIAADSFDQVDDNVASNFGRIRAESGR